MRPTVWDFSAILPVLGYLLPVVGINGYDEARRSGRFFDEEDTVVGEEAASTGRVRMVVAFRLEPCRRRGGECSKGGVGSGKAMSAHCREDKRQPARGGCLVPDEP